VKLGVLPEKKQACEDKVLRKIFGTKRRDVTGKLGILHD
jgi:hypothetical protein